ncbi:hypothetical protein G7K_1260-t1 [Saitoella complicata NRRL Y-17804]|uniref:DNA mismatch repair protein MSH3 n=1 Tax=Saitoella complicata (strain BCRC 22490 / CBS 7301 / JCM 7358 / NBRC 10748 / NRRL Y-17804) TaxID=698492 RepID=A0A0E9NAZ2_SAICN|nr:hypothetical protein G7K_1260-t1 [Saitoella complicata NRRL Y-17804]
MKQASLSSFFVPQSSGGPSSKRTDPPGEVEDDEPVSKKLRFEEHSSQDVTHTSVDVPSEDTSKFFSTPSRPAKSTPAPTPARTSISTRTERFRYDPTSSAPTETSSDGPSLSQEQQRAKDARREQFQARFMDPNSIADIKRRRENSVVTPVNDASAVAGDDEEPSTEPQSDLAKRFSAPSSTPTAALASGVPKAPPGAKLTPLERQFLALKTTHPTTLLAIQVGYKYRFFHTDALLASQHLHIASFPDHNFITASIPVHRINIHVKKLVEAGLRVGVVEQVETAALKAASGKSGVFERKLTGIHTKGTYVGDISNDVPSPSGAGAGTGYIMGLVEDVVREGTDDVKIGIIAVQPSTGDIIYDEFEDGVLRSEFETRLLHLSPCEVIIVGQVSRVTERVLSHLSTGIGEGVRMERVEKKQEFDDAFTAVSKFYADKVQKGGDNTLLDEVLKFPKGVVVCLSAMITYLTEFGIEHVFDLTKYFSPFSSRSKMLLTGNTLTSLEIFRNATDGGERGSLFWVLDRTRTKFGRRMLRKWVGRPLVRHEELEGRIEAVEEILNADSDTKRKVEALEKVLDRLPDLEKGLCRIHYGKCTRPELVLILNALYKISIAFESVADPASIGFKSALLNNSIAALPTIAEDVGKFLGMFNQAEAAKDNKYDMFGDDVAEEIGEHKMGIAMVESELGEHLKEIQTMLRRKVEYVTVAGVEYLIELRNSEANKVPKNWVKISGTKAMSRFHSPRILALLKEREQRKESLAIECDKAYADFLGKIAEKFEVFRDVVTKLAVVDCLLSLSIVASQPGYCRPTFVEGTKIEINGGRHPMVEQILADPFVPNDVELDKDGLRTVVLTGPNMGGKSSYIRMVALVSIMGQIGSYVPAESATLGILDAVFTRMGAFDNIMSGESTFMVELSETSDIMRQSTPRSLVILDELGRGTSSMDGMAIAWAVLEWFLERGGLVLFVTHYPILAELAQKYPQLCKNAHMGFMEHTSSDGSPEITFLYKLTEGVANRSYGLNVARLANLPGRVLEVAEVKAREVEEELRGRRERGWAEMARRAIGDPGSVSIEDLEALAGNIDWA